jgi:hypothetical protein
VLAATSTAVTLAEMYREEGSDPAAALGYSLGSTSDPEGFDLPAAAFEVAANAAAQGAEIRARYYARLGRNLPVQPPPHERDRRLAPPPHVVPPAPPFRVRFRLTRAASEGSNRSLYVREGIYETNYTFEAEDADAARPDWRDNMAGLIKERRADAVSRQFGLAPLPRVYFWVPGDMAERSKQAELEHLADLRRAYQLSLGQLDAALRAAEGTGRNEPEARLAAEADFVRRLDPPLRGLGLDMARWGEKYLALCSKSKGRDVQDHSFGLSLVDAGAVPALPVTYLTAAGAREENGRVFVKISVGTTRIPGQRTQDLIVY